MDFNQDWLTERLMIVIPLILSLSVHECAHAWAAFRLGDDTARLLGRMTINPLAHIDPIGTLVLPMLGVPFGWAKPVPVNPLRFTRRVSMRTGMMFTALAGPLSNLAIALIGTVLLALVLRFHPFALRTTEAVTHLLWTLTGMNVVLAVFNMLPIPPLDGSRVVDALLPRPLRPAWENLRQIGPLALAAVIVLPQLSGINLFAAPLQATEWLLKQLLTWLG
jgi:Zn-dependent protease